MRRWFLLLAATALCTIFIRDTGSATMLHAPHNAANGITCITCHQYSLPGNSWPPDFPPANPSPDDTLRNFVCVRCHSGSGPGPTKTLHSSLVVQGRIASFTTQCVDCHDPHFQSQLIWSGSNPEALYLVTGSILDVIPDNNTTIIRYSQLQTAPNWNDPAQWGQKTAIGRGLVFVVNTAAPTETFEVISATSSSITVNGIVSSLAKQQTFGLIYGQLIRSGMIDGEGAVRGVKFFDPRSEFQYAPGSPAPGGFVDRNGATPPEGICQVCHTQTNYYRTDASEPTPNHPTSSVTPDCTTCHSHDQGFKPNGQSGHGACTNGSDGCSQCHTSGRHGNHLDIGVNCAGCHDPCQVHDPQSPGTVKFADNQPLATTTVCARCHFNPTTNGAPNHSDYKAGWSNPAYHLGCDGCHFGRPNLDTQVMASNGHDRLVGVAWIRQYLCTFCHNDTVDDSWHLRTAHTNGQIDIKMDSRWNIAGLSAPTYDPASKSCNFLYCHSDGTTVTPETRQVAWSDTRKECNMCHGHKPTETSCNATDCHSDGRTGAYWNSMPEQRWLTAMPMYKNTGPGTSRANSHFRHLFTGFSCDDCHAATVQGGSCLDCHGTGIPTGAMNETAHVNGTYHVNRTKDVVFKKTGTYNPSGKTCSNTACHTGSTPQWGDTVDNIPCRDCHGTSGSDVDDYGAFNGTRAKVSLPEWEATGHGRPLAAGPYPQSGNPPADFPEKGCWYCHDNQILHQDDGQPFRLLQHNQFTRRFEKECVFCHMGGSDQECVVCHTDHESLAPQLAAIGPDPVIHPPYTQARQSHAGYVNGSGQVLVSCATCHTGDDHRHKTGSAKNWSEAEKEDIKNNYLKMGVCLKCHDDDSNGQCLGCHAAPADDPATPNIDESHRYDLGYDPGMPGTRKISATVSKATSMHFGYKHYQSYADSLVSELATGVTTAAASLPRELINATANWTPDGWKNKYLYITGGAWSGYNRLITGNTATSLTFDRPLPDEAPLAAGVSFVIRDVVWKGGKFCWDCHDPHGDANIYMIHDKVSTRTDGWSGKPFSQSQVVFTRKQSGLDYARTSAPYNGLCNVCHTDPDQHYANTRGDGHNASRVCTSCHEHRFTDSHASDQPCNSCHQNRPVPRHTGFSLPRDCAKCHAGTIGKRMNIMGQFGAKSHHIQGTAVTGKQCYACHWEATELGLIDLDHHQGYNYRTHESIPDGQIDLVIWNREESPGVDADPFKGGRPKVYDPVGTDPANTTAIPTVSTFTAANMAQNLAEERRQVGQITPHCLGCHSDQNNNSQPFGDCKTPRQYAWDRTSVGSRYSDASTTTWGKYSQYPNAAPKNLTKAFSAHGNAVANEGGYSTANGLDASLQNCGTGGNESCSTRAGGYNVQCFDCHSSHGSKVSGVTTSYVTFNNTRNGGNFKETQAGKGGYAMTYAASANPNPNNVNPYNAGAGQCFDCHETASAGTTPWGYSSTFGATKPILGYADTPRFGQGQRGAGTRYPYKSSTVKGGHFKASSSLGAQPMATIDGLCTPCHDPHGVSPSLGSDRQYAVPLLKGTWLTSPYKEDAANAHGPTGVRGSQSMNPPPTPTPNVYLDQNTLGNDRISESDQRFAGLCLNCHGKASLTDGTNNNGAWKSVDRIHESVKGWGDNQKHSYSCSKCHLPHSSTLPRLMATNCLNTTHRGRVASGGVPGNNESVWRYNSCRTVLKSYPGSFPSGKASAQGNTSAFKVNCHPTGTWPDNSWNVKTAW